MKTPINYYGSKHSMIDTIIPLIPKHKIYIEPFFGSGTVFFAKEPSTVEVINDLDRNVYNFWKVTVERFDELKEIIDLTLHGREIHNQAKIWLDLDDPVKKAWAFWYEVNGSFAKLLEAGFAYSKDKKHLIESFCENKKFLFTDKVFKRLSNCYIKNLDALDLIRRWDSLETFFFILTRHILILIWDTTGDIPKMTTKIY